MTSPASTAAQQRFHRYVALLFAATVPIMAVVELLRAHDNMAVTVGRAVGSLILTIWAVMVARAERPNAVRLVLGAMGYLGAMAFVESVLMANVTAFDYGTTYGLLLLMSVLAGTLFSRRRMVFATVLAVFVAAWVIVVGLLSGAPQDAVMMQAVIAVTGVLFTTALVSELFDQLLDAITAHERGRRLQDAVARCSEALLVHPDSFALYEAVRAVFEATDADYAYIDRTIEVDGEPGWKIVAHAEKPDESSGDGWHTGKYSQVPTTYQAMLKGEESIVKAAELSGPERDFYQQDGIVSEICVPIYIGKDFRGSIGFVEYSTPRDWSEAEIQTLWRAADMVGAYWRRQDDAEVLKEINASKDKLLASVSHEIRTPLTAIVGLSEQIVSDRSFLDPSELDELNGIIAVQSRELAELVDDLLVASRADFGNLSIRTEHVDIGEQVRRVIEGVRESVPVGKSLTVTGDNSIAIADPLRTRQIIRNLVTNAIKYGGNQVTVELSADASSVYVAVADSGAGVSKKEESLIFDRYYRSVDSPTQPGSVGIGLAVSRQLAEMMGGVLRYDRGEGTHRFVLALPLADSELADLSDGHLAKV